MPQAEQTAEDFLRIVERACAIILERASYDLAIYPL
jgi:hypothetical protein